MKSVRNKTISFSLDEGKKYLDNAVLVDRYDGSQNKTVCGDTFIALEKVADNSVDLLIVDPPYNMFKDFHGNSFSRKSDEKYREYTISWLDAVIPKLKKTASVYVCCDWKSALVIGPILNEKLILRNRITWQREKGRGAKSN